jgi:molecular chaperone GrpE
VKKSEEYLENWKRSQADFINLKRRSEQEKLEMGKYANNQLILMLLPVLDDFERAFDSITPQAAKSHWLAGIRLIETKLRDTLKSVGLIPIEALGQPFNPTLHEAVMQGKGLEGVVLQEMRKGYKVFEKVIRPSQVIVGNGEREEIDEEIDEDNQSDNKT